MQSFFNLCVHQIKVVSFKEIVTTKKCNTQLVLLVLHQDRIVKRDSQQSPHPLCGAWVILLICIVERVTFFPDPVALFSCCCCFMVFTFVFVQPCWFVCIFVYFNAWLQYVVSFWRKILAAPTKQMPQGERENILYAMHFVLSHSLWNFVGWSNFCVVELH